MEGRDTASLPPSACPLRRGWGGKTEARVGRGDGDGTGLALVRGLTDTAAAQLCTATPVLVLGRRGVRTLAPTLPIQKPSCFIPPGPSRETLWGCSDLSRGRGRWGVISAEVLHLNFLNHSRVKMQFDLRKLSQPSEIHRFWLTMATKNTTFPLTVFGHPTCDPNSPLSGSKVSFSSNSVVFEPDQLKVTYMLIHQNSQILSYPRQGQL